MAIRSRIKISEPEERPARKERVLPVVSIMPTVADRGNFEFGADPFKGSSYEAMGLDKSEARSILRRNAYVAGPPLPKEMPVQELLAQVQMPDNPTCTIERTYRKRVRSPLTAIRGYCVSCKGGSPRAVNKCDSVNCPLWAFRKGQNGMRREQAKQ